jgi:hypothetical protein
VPVVIPRAVARSVAHRTGAVAARGKTVTDTDGTPISGDETPSIVSVHSGNSGREHHVDVREGRCTCRDHRHRDATCYHLRRARYALGVEPVPTETHRYTHTDETRRERGETHGYSSPPARAGSTNPDL